MAVRLVMPTDPDLKARHLTKRKLGLFAAKTYLEKHEVTADSKGLYGHDIITYQHRIAPRHAEKICDLPITKARVSMEVSSAMMLLEATRAGLGIAELAVHLAENDPQLTRLWPEREDSYDVWLVMHGDLARTARVMAVADAIAGCFSGNKNG
jgi:DNA-binding transcriptional LysR family regulator